MTRIQAALQKPQPVGRLVLFLTAGDPDLETSLDLAVALGEKCADILELGVPFSDPIADGPIIQRSSRRSLDQGTTLAKILRLVGRLRQQSQVPVVLFSYFNPILQFGLERLAEEAAGVGVDGLLLTDLPPEEGNRYLDPIRKKGLDTIFLAAPTTSDLRLRLIAEQSSGFLYLISRTGVTGIGNRLSTELEAQIRRTRQVSRIPVAVGFGISRAEHVRQVCRHADAAIVGSALVQCIEETTHCRDQVEQVVRFAKSLKSIAE